MDKTTAFEKLRSIGQQHLLEYFDRISDSQQELLLAQIEGLNIPHLRIQQQMLMRSPHAPYRFLDPFRDFDNIDSSENIDLGKRLISEGKVGCLIVAGGQGTRLRFNGPKGMFPVTVIKEKSLFQLFAEKVLAAGNQANRLLPLAVMTSPQNHEQTIHLFKEHQYFGLSEGQVRFFCQEMLPLLDHDGKMFLDTPWHIAMGPNGNGSSLRHFVDSGIWEEWYQQGVRYLNYVLIDNPLADPFDAELFGYQHKQGADVVVKCTPRRDSQEKVGILIKHEDKVKVIEYSELPEEERTGTLEDGSLKHVCANLSLFSFSMDFVKTAAKTQIPLHVAHKAVKTLTAEGSTIQAKEPNAWKFEEFIFDILPLALKVKALLYPREECFAPLKNAEGDASLSTVHAALQARDRQQFQKISEAEPPDRPFELSQQFYYPTPELLEKWKGMTLPKEEYIQP